MLEVVCKKFGLFWVRQKILWVGPAGHFFGLKAAGRDDGLWLGQDCGMWKILCEMFDVTIF